MRILAQVRFDKGDTVNLRDLWCRSIFLYKVLLVVLGLSGVCALVLATQFYGWAMFPITLVVIGWIGVPWLLIHTDGWKDPLFFLGGAALWSGFGFSWNFRSEPHWNWMTVLAVVFLLMLFVTAHKSKYLPTWRRYIETLELKRRAREQ